MADLEELVLSGALFSTSRSSSPERSPSPDAGWHDDQLNLDDDDDDTARRAAFERQLNNNTESIGMGPGRTGVKGVIRDRNEAEQIQRESKSRELAAMTRQMEKANLGGKTYLEEEREKGDDADELVLRERERIEERRNVFGQTRQGRFGHLREVGVKGFLSAVEGETKGTWIVVHLYEPSLDRCYTLDERLSLLARAYPDTKFLRARASALGFTSSGRADPQFTRAARQMPQDDEDDPYDEKDIGDYDEEEEEDDGDVDLDMLPTMLVYRDGELVHNWVRVDWEAGKAGIDNLLDRHHILPQSTAHSRNLGLPSDDSDEDDLVWSDDEDGLV